MNVKEHWKDIPGFEGYYQVSDCGNIRSVDREVPCKNGTSKRLKGRVMAQSIHYRNGYKSVILTSGSKQKRFLVHRLVAQAFLPNPDHLPEINHKDENRANNLLSNLEWCTRTYNNRYGTKRERLSICRSKPVRQMKDGVMVAEYPSATEAAELIGGYQSGISGCCRGEYKHYKGYEWVFV